MKKKVINQERRLSLKKVQVMKISEMKTINGGDANSDNDEPGTYLPQNTASVRN
ncbi:TPA: hypothetical protein ACG0AO_002058 [Elizabethkingia meningoseptica]|uniref:hypothetical protein n=1 Tax=Elizabethkingia meningoseptica TaxID=238 RepID=UPI001590DD7E|nr:hypothetical protein [Elizabethkingia meningoseptica]